MAAEEKQQQQGGLLGQEDSSSTSSTLRHDEEDIITLSTTSEAINSLISSSCSISLFPLKWQLIRDKLHHLHSGLSTAAETTTSSNSRLNKLLHAIIATSKEAHLLIQRSAGKHYGGGKLLLRSDLNVLTSKLEAHIKHLEEIYTSGILTQARALVVQKPGPSACSNDMRFYVRDLFSRLKIGNGKSDMREQAIAALNEVFREDDKYVRVVMADVADGIGVIVRLVECRDSNRVQQEALEAVSVIAGFDSYKPALVVAGVIGSTIRVLHTGTALLKEKAVRCLNKLTENSDNAWAVAAHGGVTALLNLCGDANNSNSIELIGMASSVLRSLSAVDEIKTYMVEAGAVPVFMSLSQLESETTQIQAMEFLAAISSDDNSIKQVLLRECVVESLVDALDPSSSHSSKAREVALRAIEMLCFSSTACINQLIGAGFLNRVLFFLQNGDNSVQHSALKAACRLCGMSEETKKAMGDAGFMPEFVKILETQSMEVREMAAEAICGMVSVQKNRRKFIQEQGSVDRILQLLGQDKEKQAVTKRFLISALMHLTDSNSGRRKIASSEHVKHLEKLAEANVVDAKKVVKKLAGNRFRSILSGILSL